LPRPAKIASVDLKNRQALKIMLLTHGTGVELLSASRLRYMRFDDYVLSYLVAAEGGAEMKRRKPVLIVDDSPDSLKAMDLLRERGIEFVEYDVRKFAESCCGDLPTTKAPSVFAPEGVFKGLRGVEEYITSTAAANEKAIGSESESAYW
jgi:hypothetical protein